MTILFITTRHRYVFFCKCTAQNLVWKMVFHSILEIFYSILASSIPKFPLHFIPYHALVVDSVLLLLLHFTPMVVASLKIRKGLILKTLLPLPAPFQHFRFRVRFCFQPLLSKCFRFHKKLTASTSLLQGVNNYKKFINK